MNKSTRRDGVELVAKYDHDDDGDDDDNDDDVELFANDPKKNNQNS